MRALTAYLISDVASYALLGIVIRASHTSSSTLDMHGSSGCLYASFFDMSARTFVSSDESSARLCP
jgi:hypothetical protein